MVKLGHTLIIMVIYSNAIFWDILGDWINEFTAAQPQRSLSRNWADSFAREAPINNGSQWANSFANEYNTPNNLITDFVNEEQSFGRIFDK
mgnify:CR=1 FL=1